MPPFSPISPIEIAAVYLAEMLFGLGFDALVGWAHRRRLWPAAFSVVMGVAGTLALPALFWTWRVLPFWGSSMLLLGCFAMSGPPMIVGSIRRGLLRKESHKRRAWPTEAARARDAAIMDLTALAHEIGESAREGTLTAGHLPGYVNKIFSVIGTLKSV